MSEGNLTTKLDFGNLQLFLPGHWEEKEPQGEGTIFHGLRDDRSLRLVTLSMGGETPGEKQQNLADWLEHLMGVEKEVTLERASIEAMGTQQRGELTGAGYISVHPAGNRIALCETLVASDGRALMIYYEFLKLQREDIQIERFLSEFETILGTIQM